MSENSTFEIPKGFSIDTEVLRNGPTTLSMLENHITLCPKCLHPLTSRHVELLKKAIKAIQLLPDHLDRLGEKDFYCEDCFE